MCSSQVGVKVSNETEILAIRRALKIFKEYFLEKLIVKSDSTNTIRLVSSSSGVGSFSLS